MTGDRMVFGGPASSLSRRFGHPIALSASGDVDLRAFSTQGYNGVLDVIEASYMVRGDEEARVQPSVWTWLANGTSPEEAAVIHAVTHHISHLAEFRVGSSVPDSDETDRLHQALVQSPRTSSSLKVGGGSTVVTRFALDAWVYGYCIVGPTFVTVAGPAWFVECPIRLLTQ